MNLSPGCGRGAAVAAFVLMLCVAVRAHAGSGFLGIDHTVNLDNGGIWARKYQEALIAVLLVGEAGGALYEGGDSRLGRTLWVSIDATVVGGASSLVLKRVFSRVRPSETSNPNEWFKGRGNESFPSGEVTVTSSVVTPLVLEYAHDYPAVYALELLPLYDSIARVKVHGHWQSDVIAGFALGTAAGYLMHSRTKSPIVLSVMPGWVYAGFSKTF